MTATQSLNLYNLSLRFLKNEADAKAFVEQIEEVVDNKFIVAKEILANKQDIAEVRIEAKENKSEMIKWMFIFWVGSTMATLGGMIAIVRFMIAK